MKKSLFFLFAASLIFSACSKDRKISRLLDGSWNVTMYENVIISPQTQYIYNFNKEKKGKGSGTYSIAYPGFSTTKDFTYEINNQTMKYMVKDSTGATVTTYLSVAAYNKNKMILVNVANNKVTNLRAR